MKLEDFDYNLPTKLIAQTPSEQRDQARFLVYEKGVVKHQKFYDLVDILQVGDVLVLNDSKVFPARLHGARVDTASSVEVFLLRDQGQGVWECLIGHARTKAGLQIEFPQGLQAELVEQQEERWLVRFNQTGEQFMNTINQIGSTPTPPYIKTKDSEEIREEYQTVYADKIGSVAAPTAGFHFTEELLAKLKVKGVQIEYVTLHVGLGTFALVKVDNIKEHKMHSEYYQVDQDVWQRIKKAKEEKRRVVSVGTTATRVLESVAREEELQGWTNIFIYPGFEYKVVDSLITNFHLPKSTLLMLVAALLENKGSKDGIKELKKIYQEAIDKEYRFYSFGDAMMIV
ncbi:MAG: tRNA preQ1(34) S-adenosylmethionine ribosyltransferase-isomerase QueA [Candidatus Komeilibacteria bacterium]